MIGVLGHDLCTDEALLGRGTTWVNEANFVKKHTPRHSPDRSLVLEVWILARATKWATAARRLVTHEVEVKSQGEGEGSF